MEKGIIGLEVYFLFCFFMVEGEVVYCVISILEIIGVFLYLVYCLV